MKGQIYNGKKVIWKSKTKQILLITVSFFFTAIGIWVLIKGEPINFTIISTFLLFGIGGIVFLFRLLNPQNLFVTHNSDLGKEILADQFKKIYDDLGFFSYDNLGFNFKQNTGSIYYKWSDILTLFGYKEDYFIIDEICLDIFTCDSYIKLYESIPGWYQFNIRLLENIPGIPNNWEEVISAPAFETSLILLYDKQGRTKEQAEAECYKN
jgi:hypothetical protein